MTTHWRVNHLVICGIKCHGTKELRRWPQRTLQRTVIRAVITVLAGSENTHISGVSYSGCVVMYHKHLMFIRSKIKSRLSLRKKKGLQSGHKNLPHDSVLSWIWERLYVPKRRYADTGTRWVITQNSPALRYFPVEAWYRASVQESPFASQVWSQPRSCPVSNAHATSQPVTAAKRQHVPPNGRGQTCDPKR